MIFFFHYLPRKAMNIFAPFEEDRQPVMTVKDNSVRPSLQRSRLSRL